MSANLAPHHPPSRHRLQVFGPLCGSLREFCTHCDPHSGPSRAERRKRNWQPAEGLGGDIKGRRPLAGPGGGAQLQQLTNAVAADLPSRPDAQHQQRAWPWSRMRRSNAAKSPGLPPMALIRRKLDSRIQSFLGCAHKSDSQSPPVLLGNVFRCRSVRGANMRCVCVRSLVGVLAIWALPIVGFGARRHSDRYSDRYHRRSTARRDHHRSSRGDGEQLRGCDRRKRRLPAPLKNGPLPGRRSTRRVFQRHAQPAWRYWWDSGSSSTSR